MEIFFSKLLRLGVVLSGFLMIIGLGLLWLTGNTDYSTGVMTLNWIIFGDPFFEPSHVLFIGFLILVGTPIFPLAMSSVAFYKAKDWVYTIITSAVLIILLLSMSLGIG
jgi:uncharacterized membrane protein